MSKRSDTFNDMNTDHLMCRSWNHSWEHDKTVVEREGRISVYRAMIYCTRCGLYKEVTIRASNGERLGYRYIGYADGYLIEHPEKWGGRREFNKNVSLELMQRLTSKRLSRAALRVVKGGKK